MTPAPVPPRLAERILAALVGHPEWRDSIIGDLREEFSDLTTREGRRSARRWYWRQSMAISSRSVTSRLGLPRLLARSGRHS